MMPRPATVADTLPVAHKLMIRVEFKTHAGVPSLLLQLRIPAMLAAM